MKKYLFIIVILCNFISVYAAKSPLNDFYFYGEVPDSQAIGRGEAYAGVIGSPFAPYWNPAGLVSLKRSNLGISLNIYSEGDIESDLIKKSYPLEGRSLNYISVCGEQVGFYWRSLSNRIDISSGRVAGVDFEQTIDEKINMFGISVAVPHSEKTDFGMNINFITGIIGLSRIEGSVPTVEVSDGFGWGLDWGIIYKVTEGLNAGISLLNGPAIIYWEDFAEDRLPPVFRGGFDIQLSQLMSLGLDYEKGFYDDSVKDKEKIHMGIEQYITKNFLLRAGIYGSDFYDVYRTVYTTGVGYRKKDYSIDMAAKQYYINENKLKRFSLSVVIPF